MSAFLSRFSPRSEVFIGANLRIVMKKIVVVTSLTIVVIAAMSVVLVGEPPQEVVTSEATSPAAENPVKKGKGAQAETHSNLNSIDPNFSLTYSTPVHITSETKKKTPNFMAEWEPRDVQNYREYLFTRFGFPTDTHDDAQLYSVISQMSDRELKPFIDEVFRNKAETQRYIQTLESIKELEQSNRRTALLIQHKEKMTIRIIQALRESGVLVAVGPRGVAK